jgi:hypothetical protein
MLRAVIHAGLHKTGTTSFQRSCNNASSELLKAGIYYPKSRKPHHNNFANLPDTDWIRMFARKSKKLMRDGCLLVSAENFEYRFHHDYPEKIERTLYQSGIKNITWVLCFRNPFSSYCSLYSQLSDPSRNSGNTYPILEFASSGRLAAAKGFLDFQNQNLEQRFYFNYPSLVNSLRNRLKGQVLGIDFDDFTKNCNTPGDLLIQSISNDGRNLSDCIGQVSGHSNVSPSKDAIEHNYLRIFHSKKGIKLPAWFDKAVQDRLESRIAQEPKIEALFQQNFGDWRDCLSTPDDFKRQLQKPNFWRRFFI